MTVKDLIEELQMIDKKYQSYEVVIYNTGSADVHYIDSVGDEPNYEDENEENYYDKEIGIYIS
tara:strand:+ start:1688 stop:1876 length:189 start_codon:yes stop_codon:yes gene_type:complete